MRFQVGDIVKVKKDYRDNVTERLKEGEVLKVDDSSNREYPYTVHWTGTHMSGNWKEEQLRLVRRPE